MNIISGETKTNTKTDSATPSQDELRELGQAHSLLRSRDFAEAIPVINRIIVLRKWRDADISETTLWFVELAYCLREVKQFDAAAAILQKVYAVYESTFAEDHSLRVIAHQNMALALAEAGDADKALEVLPTAASNAARTEGIKSFACALCYSHWLDCLRKKERWSEVILIGEKYLSEFGHYEPRDCCTQVMETQVSIAHAYRKLNNYENAVVYFEAAVQNLRAKWGDADKRTLDALRWLARTEVLNNVRQAYLKESAEKA